MCIYMHSKFHFNTLSLWRQSTHSQVPQKYKKTSKTKTKYQKDSLIAAMDTMKQMNIAVTQG